MEETFFSRLYEVTPSVEKYLERIGYTGKAEPTLECLNALISAHQRSVPYENLDVGRYHLPITLNIDHLYEKIVLNHRGGYCFENNTSFLSLLRGVGFDARPCMCRIMVGVPGVVPQVSHRASIITISPMPSSIRTRSPISGPGPVASSWKTGR